MELTDKQVKEKLARELTDPQTTLRIFNLIMSYSMEDVEQHKEYQRQYKLKRKIIDKNRPLAAKAAKAGA